MKKYLLILFFTICTLYIYGQSKIPELPTVGNKFTDLVLKDWKVLSYSRGDINKDGINDIVFAIQNTSLKNLKPSGALLGIDTLNYNPRILSIYFGKSDGTLEKKLQANNFIILQDSPTMEEPFDGLKIQDNGVLQIDFHLWFSAGTWYTSNHQYKFKFRNNRFELIGYESNEKHRGTGYTTNYSINFLTRKMCITTTAIDLETDKKSIVKECEKFKLQKLKTITSLVKPFNWEFHEIKI